MKQDMTGWHQLDLQITCTSLQTDNHASTASLNFYRPDALSGTQPMQWRQEKTNTILVTACNKPLSNETSGQNHLTQGHIAAAHVRFNHIFPRFCQCDPHLTWLHNPNRSSVGSDVFARFMHDCGRQADRPTDHATSSVTYVILQCGIKRQSVVSTYTWIKSALIYIHKYCNTIALHALMPSSLQNDTMSVSKVKWWNNTITLDTFIQLYRIRAWSVQPRISGTKQFSHQL